MKHEHDQDWEDAGTKAALMKRFTEHRLPRAERMLERVRGGEKLSDYDIRILNTIYRDGRQIMQLLHRHPAYGPLTTKAMDLYTEITTLGLENQKTG
jgi:hypothetical protein